MPRTPQIVLATLTPNPALDLSGQVSSLIPNEKNSVHEERRDPGGNGINAGRIAARLGIRPVLLGFLGGAVGSQLLEALKREGLAARFTPIQGETRVNVTVTRKDTHQQTRLSFAGPRVRPSEIRALLNEVDQIPSPALLILGGSLPPGCPGDFLARIGSRASERGIGVILDAPASVLTPALRRFRPLLIKPNRTELEALVGTSLPTVESVAAAACHLTERATLVCVSLGADGALLAFRPEPGNPNAVAWQLLSPKVRARGTVGAGDSLVGGFASELVRHGIASETALFASFSKERKPHGPNRRPVLPRILEAALRTGMAAGAATAATLGTGLGRKPEILRLKPKVRVARSFLEC
jgi:6-phosphofructokinase 2